MVLDPLRVVFFGLLALCHFCRVYHQHYHYCRLLVYRLLRARPFLFLFLSEICHMVLYLL